MVQQREAHFAAEKRISEREFDNSQKPCTALMKHLWNILLLNQEFKGCRSCCYFVAVLIRVKAFLANGFIHVRPNHLFRVAESRICRRRNIFLVFIFMILSRVIAVMALS